MSKKPRLKAKTVTRIENQHEKVCRACLDKGEMPINKDTDDLLDAVRKFGEVEINEDDPYPKYLCKACYTLLQHAIQFRETIQSSDRILRQQSVKKEDQNEKDHPPSPELDAVECPDDESDQETNENKPLLELKRDIPEKTKTGQKAQCEICKKSISKYYYKDHLALHGYGTPKPKVKVDCKVCNKSMEKSYYKQHMSTVHGEEHSKYVCFICGKVFRFQSGYKSHILSHSNEFPYKCQHCPYKGRHSGLLKTHMRVHERDYKFQCSQCAARFLTSGNLNKHMLKHKEKEFKCDGCARAFHTKSDLEQHYQVDHLGIKSHMCNICEKAFGYRKAMMKHMSKVHRRAKQQCGRIPSYLTVTNTVESSQE